MNTPPGDSANDDLVYVAAGVRLPRQLLQAHSRGELVLFVGAGASYAAPANLPLFRELARVLAKRAAVEGPNETEPLDAFLGQLPASFSVHRHTADLIGDPSSKPNRAHRALVNLAASSTKPMIVTTNFDDHLRNSAKLEGLGWPHSWWAPALPLADDFEGVVHLHGLVGSRERDLVLTESDFGRAYVTHGWAARFLTAMFARYTVLFVGYSHDDPLMRYLAKGLNGAGPRYALIAEDKPEASWKALGIRAFKYPLRGKSHDALVEVLETWDRDARRQPKEHRIRMSEVLARGLPLTPEDESYLATRLATSQGVEDFYSASCALYRDDELLKEERSAVLRAWLTWIVTRGEGRAIFEDGHAAPEIEAQFANWFAYCFVENPDLTRAALWAVARAGSQVSAAVLQRLPGALMHLERTDPEAAEAWRVLAATRLTSRLVEVPPLEEYGNDVEPAPSRARLKSALTPQLRLSTFTYGEPSPESMPVGDVSWPATSSALAGGLERYRTVNPGTEGYLVRLLEDAILSAYDLLEAYSGPAHFDILGMGLESIATAGSDFNDDPLAMVVAQLRDSVVASPELIPHAVARWLSDAPRLLRRLAIHLIAFHPDLDADGKVELLRGTVSSWNIDALNALKQVFEDTTDSCRERLLSGVESGESVPDRLPTDVTREDWIRWEVAAIAGAVPLWAEAVTSAERLNPPTPEPGEPDRVRIPHTVEEFLELWQNDRTALASALAHELGNLPYEYLALERESGRIVRDVAADDPALGVVVARTLISENVRPSLAVGLVLEGYKRDGFGSLPSAAAAAVEDWAKSGVSPRELASLLRESLQAPDVAPDVAPEQLARMCGVANAIAESSLAGFCAAEHEAPNPDHFPDLNQWPGMLANFWITAAGMRWSAERDTWTGFNEQESSELRRLLNQSAPQAVGAVARRVDWMYRADPEFTATNVIALFRASNEWNKYAWHSFLHHPFVSRGLLDAGFQRVLKEAWPIAAAMDRTGLAAQFRHLVGAVATQGVLPAEAVEELLAAGVVHGTEFSTAQAVRGVARALSRHATPEEVYDEWLGEYLRKRLNGEPRDMSERERSEWLALVLLLGERANDALAQFDTSLRVSLQSLPPLPDEGAPALSKIPEVATEVLRRLLDGTQPEDVVTNRYLVRRLFKQEVLAEDLGQENLELLRKTAEQVGFDLVD